MNIARDVSLCISLVLSTLSVEAAEATKTFSIEPQGLATALDTYAKQAELEIFYPDEAVQGRRSEGVSGSFTSREALDKLLNGSGLQYSFTGEDTVAIKKLAQAADGREPHNDSSDKATRSTALPELTVTARPWNAGSYFVRESVTATKTDTPIIDTPASIQIIPQQIIRDQQAINLQDALNNVSGVFADHGTAGSFAEDSFLIRGFPTQRAGFSTAYRDGFLSILGGRFSLANVERLEVLKGTAAFLYGRLEPGGLVNIVSKRPQNTPYYSLQQQFGSYSEYRTLADATGPLTHDGSLAYRLNFEYRNDGSFRDFQFMDRKFLAPSLTWQVDSKTTVDADFMYQSEAFRPDPGIPAIGRRPASVPSSRWIGEPIDSFSTEYYATTVSLTHLINDSWTVKGRFSYLADRGGDNLQIFPGGDLNETTGDQARGYFNFPGGDRDNYFVTLNLTGKIRTWQLEHTLLAGFDYFQREEAGAAGVFTLPGDPVNPPSLNIFRPVYGMPGFIAPGLPATSTPFTQQQDWWGIYLQDQVALTEQWHLLLGGRYDNASLSDSGGTDQTDREFSQRYGLLYHPLPWLSLYGSYSEGFNAANTGRVVNGSPAPEHSNQYEAGIKSEWFDKRLIATLAFYELTKSGIAISAQDRLLSAAGFVELLGRARSKGMELDIAGQITPEIRLIASYSLTNARILEDRDENGGPRNTGNRLAAVPSHAGSLWATYDFTNHGLQGFSSGLGVYMVGQRAGDPENTFDLPGYVRLDTMIRYQHQFGPTLLSAQFNVQNLLDKDYWTTGGGGRFAIPASPRTFMGALKIEF